MQKKTVYRAIVFHVDLKMRHGNDKGSKVMFEAALQLIREREDIVGTRYICDEVGKMCYDEKAIRIAWKRHTAHGESEDE